MQFTLHQQQHCVSQPGDMVPYVDNEEQLVEKVIKIDLNNHKETESSTDAEIKRSDSCIPLRKKSSFRQPSCNEEIPIKTEASAWMVLPKPDMKKTRSQSAPANCEPSAESMSKQEKDIFRGRVNFSEVTVREYDVTLGDNPSVSCGAPISLDWGYEEVCSLHVEEYEGTRPPRRNTQQMMMNYYVRRDKLMLSCGCTAEEIKKASRSASRTRRGRGITNYFMPVLKLGEVADTAQRKVKRIVKRTKSV